MVFSVTVISSPAAPKFVRFSIEYWGSSGRTSVWRSKDGAASDDPRSMTRAEKEIMASEALSIDLLCLRTTQRKVVRCPSQFHSMISRLWTPATMGDEVLFYML